MGPTTVSDVSLEDRVREYCLAIFLQRRLVPALGIFFVACLIAFPAWGLAGASVVLPFLAAAVVVTSLSCLTKRWISNTPRRPSNYLKRSMMAAGTNVLTGCAVSAGLIWLHRAGGNEMFVYVVLVQAGLSAGTLATSAYHPPAMCCYLILSLGPYILSLFFVPPSLHIEVVGLGLVFILGYMLVTGFQQARNIRASARLQHQNDDLLLQLRQETDMAEAARQDAERANEEKSRFFASASHDLRQPVHALNLYASLLRDPASDTEREEVLERITTCVDTLDDLFDSLLTVTRAEGQSGDRMRLGPVSLQAIIETAVGQFSPIAEAHGVALTAAPTSAWVLGEKLALERIVSNFVSNAISFTPSGRILIGVRRRGTRLELQVWDTGIGMREDERSRIFGEFYQVDNPGRRAGKGFGLGLVIVQRLCRALDYRISVQSIPGRGSGFAVSMPRCAARALAAVEPPAANLPHLARHTRVLVVDDDANARDAMARILGQWSVDAEICGSSAEALSRARDPDVMPDCLLLDQRLGENIGGLELAGQLRALLHKDVPVAIITGETAGKWMDQAHAQGYTVLLKPVKPIRLRAFLAAATAPAASPHETLTP